MIPAGVPHRSLSEPDGVLCFNAYVPPVEYAVADLMSAIRRLRLEANHICWEGVATAIRHHQSGLREIACDAVAAPVDVLQRLVRLPPAWERAAKDFHGLSSSTTECRRMPIGSCTVSIRRGICFARVKPSLMSPSRRVSLIRAILAAGSSELSASRPDCIVALSADHIRFRPVESSA